MLDLIAFLREVFSRIPVARSVEIERHGSHYLVYVTVAPGSDQKPLYGTLQAILHKRPDLSIDLFVEEEF